MAVGSYEAANGDLYPMAIHYAGGHWARAVALHAAPRGGSRPRLEQIGSVACTATGCAAVGQYAGNSPGMVPVAVSESAGRWHRAVRVALPAGHGTGPELQGFLHGIACSGDTCTAVGFFLHVHNQVLAMASTNR